MYAFKEWLASREINEAGWLSGIGNKIGGWFGRNQSSQQTQATSNGFTPPPMRNQPLSPEEISTAKYRELDRARDLPGWGERNPNPNSQSSFTPPPMRSRPLSGDEIEDAQHRELGQVMSKPGWQPEPNDPRFPKPQQPETQVDRDVRLYGAGNARMSPAQNLSSQQVRQYGRQQPQNTSGQTNQSGPATSGNMPTQAGLSKSVNADLWRLNQAAQKYGTNHQVTQNQIASLKNQGYTAILKPDGTYTVSR